MKKRNSIIKLSAIGVLLVIAFLAAFLPMEFGMTDYKSFSGNIRLGLDLSGGVEAVFHASLPPGASGSVSELMPGTIANLRSTLNSRGFPESTIQIEGGTNLRVSVPGVDDTGDASRQILQILGSPMQVVFVHNGREIIRGENITQAAAQFQAPEHVVALRFDNAGRDAFAEATRNEGDIIEIFAEDAHGNRTLLSSPRVQSHITNGQAVITGMGSADGAERLAGQINAGMLPLVLEQLSVTTISATLGEGAIMYGLIAGAIGILLVMIFLIVFYGLFGVGGAITMLIYTALMIIVLALFPWVQLTLPGIAGVLLSIGMAIDGNIIIYERIKDEYRNGKSILSSSYYGYRKSIRTILDANITTVLAAVVLLFLGTGPVQGFAMTLLIGIVLAAFTSLVVARWLIKIMIDINQTNPKLYRLRRGKGFEDLGAGQDSAAAAMQIEEEARIKRLKKEKEETEKRKKLEGGAV
ncbi:MAG: protein translocase subunit SecD [Firmicutes bacterium]|nr:protein translocase subunit SecD [Bacillota bacterium]